MQRKTFRKGDGNRSVTDCVFLCFLLCSLLMRCFEQCIQVFRFFWGQIMPIFQDLSGFKMHVSFVCGWLNQTLLSCFFCKAWTFLYHSMSSSMLWWDASDGFLCWFGSAAGQPSVDLGPFPKHLQMAFQADLVWPSSILDLVWPNSTWNALYRLKRNPRSSQVASLGQTW